MEKRVFSKKEKLAIIREASINGVTPTLEKHGIYSASYYSWKKKFESMGEEGFNHGMTPQFLKRIRELEKEKPQLIFTFVGNQFFGKGGREVLNVFKKICLQHPDIKLNIISNFSPDSYASATTKQNVEQLKKEFPQLPANIHILGSIKNEQVLKILCNSHVALLPTYADTYGYFVLEAQACGCPVISTDIRALPEINNNECGWMIKVPKDDSGNGKLRTNSERIFFSSIIERELFSIINEIVVDPSIISKKRQNAIGRIKSDHDPNAFSKQLKLIYEKSLMS